LTNPRRECRLLKLVELSGVGRVMDDGVDEDAAHAERLGERIFRETEEREGMG